MKLFFILILKIYQKFYPQNWKRTCIFEESCSHHVLRITRERGFVEGIKSLVNRFRNCRPGYYIIKEEGKIFLITCKYEIIEEKIISSVIIQKHLDEIRSPFKKVNDEVNS